MIPGHEHEFAPVVPFKVCRSAGGPYEDEAFVAGYQTGEVDTKLSVAAALNAPSLELPLIRRALLPQLELHGMRYGYPVLSTDDPDSGVPGSDEWCTVHFKRGERP